MYEEEIEYLKREEHQTMVRRKIANDACLDQLRKQWPGIPNEYLSYLSEIGSGSILNNGFHVWNYIWDAKDMIGEVIDGRYQFFGHGFDGDVSGFDTLGGFSVVEWWHDSRRIYGKSIGFKEYIKEKIYG